ncbi:MAG: potassium channel protein [Elusimicrobiota bacterium]
MYAEIYTRFRFILGSLFTVLALGTAGYTLIEGWPLFDALYMTVITLATIGFGEIHPLSNTGRAFTIMLSISGLGVVAYSFSAITAYIVEGGLSETLRRRRMEDRIKQLKDHYIICGAGFTGQSIIDELDKTDRPFVIVDMDEKKVSSLADRGHLVIQGDALRDETLERAAIMDAKGLFCTLDRDPDNVFVAISARGLNPRLRIISEVHDGRVRDKLLRGGADVCVSSTHIGGLRMASEMIRPTTVGFLDSMIRDRDSAYRFEEVTIRKGARVIGKNIGSLKHDDDDSPLVLAIKEPEIARYRINPPAEHKIEEDDILVVIGDTDQIRKFRESL